MTTTLLDAVDQWTEELDTLRRCYRCDEVKTLEEFYRNRNENRGRGYKCLDCHRQDQAQKRDELRNLAGRRPPEDTPRRCPSCGETKTVGDFHRDRSQPLDIQVRCIKCSKKRAKRSGYRRHVKRLAAVDGSRCALGILCDREHVEDPYTLTVEHVHPKACGGKDTITNLMLACLSCNTSKGTKPLRKVSPEAYARWRDPARTEALLRDAEPKSTKIFPV